MKIAIFRLSLSAFMLLQTVVSRGDDISRYPGEYGIQQHAFFRQTTPSQPTSSTTWSFVASIASGWNYGVYPSGQEITSAIFTPASWAPRQMSSGNLIEYWSNYSSKEAMDAEFGSGLYNFYVTEGSLWPGSASLVLPEDEFYPEVPYFNEETFFALQNYDPSKPFTFTWNEFIPDQSSNYSFLWFSIAKSPPYTTIYSGAQPQGGVSFTAPANTLLQNTTYTATVAFMNRLTTPDAGFDGYTSMVTYQYFTQLDFTTIPEPNSLGVIGGGIVGLWLIGRNRKRRWSNIRDIR